MSRTQLSGRQLEAFERDLRDRGVERCERLTVARARSFMARLEPEILIVAERADKEALTLLRGEGRSYYIEGTGEAYLSPRMTRELSPSTSIRRYTDPFALRASRICRHLLLHPTDEFTINALAKAAEVDKSVVSRVVAELEREALIRVKTNAEDARSRVVRLTNPRRLLEEWRITWRRTRVPRKRFDIGTNSVDQSLQIIADAGKDSSAPWAISGVAGASFLRRAVEPADVLLLTTTDGLVEWQTKLFAEPSSGTGLLRIASIRDPFVFSLAWPHHRLRVADPVQLWLDTAIAGERAAEAAEAIAKEMRW
jgi:DNA-binding MarR family transcriptional regulator